MTTKQPRKAYHFVDSEGTFLVRVPLANSSDCAVIQKEDFADLMAAGISDQWMLNSSGNGHEYVRCRVYGERGGMTTIARLIKKPPRGYRVIYVDGDVRNLRWDNLELVRGARPKKLPPLPAKSKARAAGDVESRQRRCCGVSGAFGGR